MNLTVVGATGGVGRHVVDLAIDAGHTVTAAVRTPANLHRKIDAVAVDLARPDERTLRRAVSGADAVISCLGPRRAAEYGIVTRGTRAIVDAMHREGRRRLVVVSGAGVSIAATPYRPHPPRREAGAGWYNQYFATPLSRRVLGTHFVDVATMEGLLLASGLDWTAVRPALLTDGPMRGKYRIAVERNVRRGLRISRADIAHLLLRVVSDPATVGTAVAAAY